MAAELAEIELTGDIPPTELEHAYYRQNNGLAEAS